MDDFWKSINEINDRLVIFALILLVIIIIVEIFIPIKNPDILLGIMIVDYIITAIFVVDVCFLYKKSKNLKYFFTHHWLDILAIFPFALFFRFTTEFYKVAIETERLTISQKLLHETAKLGKLAEFFSKASRTIARLLRVVTKSVSFRKFYATFYPNSKRYDVADKAYDK